MKNATQLLMELIEDVSQSECHGMLLVVVRPDHTVELAAVGTGCDRLTALRAACDEAIRVVQGSEGIPVDAEPIN